MTDKTFLFRSSAGIDHYMVQDGKDTRFAASMDTTPIIERNKAEANHNDGYSESREIRRVARIPYIVGLKWLNEEGWWFMDAGKDPDVAKKLAAKLNSNEYLYLRTAEGQVGVSDGRLR